MAALPIDGSTAILDTELRERLGLADNKALAGVLAGISKRARSAGIDIRGVIVKTIHRNGSGERHYSYRIVPEAAEEVRAGLGLNS